MPNAMDSLTDVTDIIPAVRARSKRVCGAPMLKSHTLQACASQVQSVLNAAKSECLRVSSLADFERSPCILPSFVKNLAHAPPY